MANERDYNAGTRGLTGAPRGYHRSRGPQDNRGSARMFDDVPERNMTMADIEAMDSGEYQTTPRESVVEKPVGWDDWGGHEFSEAQQARDAAKPKKPGGFWDDFLGGMGTSMGAGGGAKGAMAAAGPKGMQGGKR